jgi:hypothetical protein
MGSFMLIDAGRLGSATAAIVPRTASEPPTFPATETSWRPRIRLGPEYEEIGVGLLRQPVMAWQ